MKELTKAEEQVMQVLWKLNKAFVKDVIDCLPEPKPAYNTVSTIIRILERKGFVGFEAFGRTHRYFPIVNKNDYTKSYINGFVRNYFSNSYRRMVSFFAEEENLSLKDLENLRDHLESQIRTRKVGGK